MKIIVNPFAKECISKLEHFCSYQERCHFEVVQKLKVFDLSEEEKNTIIVHLIEQNYLNEERFSTVFTLSKLHQKKWGKIRIKNELKQRKISDYLIKKSLLLIEYEEYEAIFNNLAEKYWDSINDNNSLKKRKKACDFLLRKGFESEIVYKKIMDLENKK